MDFYKFLTNLIRFKSEIDTLTNTFFPQTGKKGENLSSLSKEEIVTKIQKMIRRKLAAMKQKVGSYKSKINYGDTTDQVDLKNYTYAEIIQNIREACESAKKNPK